MRNLLILGMLVGAAFMANWFTVERDGDNTTIQINRQEIREDAAAAIDRGRDFIDRRREQRAAEQAALEQNGGLPANDSGFNQGQSNFAGQPGSLPPNTGDYGNQRYERPQYEPAFPPNRLPPAEPYTTPAGQSASYRLPALPPASSNR